FSAFADAEIDFSPGINVLVGANGTGKSHLMKLAYGTLRTFGVGRGRSTLKPVQELESKLAELFQPDGLNVGRVVRRRVGKGGLGGGNNRATVDIAFVRGGHALFTLHTKGPQHVRLQTTPRARLGTAVFLPPHEMLTLGSAFVDLAREYEVPFDATYADAAAALGRPALKTRPAFIRDIETRLLASLGGEVIREEGRFYVRLRGGGKMEAPLLAEGLRKLASLIRLLQNGSIRRGSVLFWDEPETNLNPILTNTIVETINELATHGVQVVLATHDYFVASRLSLIGQKRPEKGRRRTRVRFIGLAVPDDSDADGTVLESPGVLVHEADQLEALPEALLVKALIDHADFERSVVLKGALDR